MPLTLHLRSFSFKYDPAPSERAGEHGGGFVFDCRLLPNPGREVALKSLHGKNHEVRQYLEQRPEVQEFLTQCEHLVALSIRRYLERGFSDLHVEFGCTGGQHRSVYCAEALAAEMQQRFAPEIAAGKLEVHLEHVGLRRMGYA